MERSIGEPAGPRRSPPLLQSGTRSGHDVEIEEWLDAEVNFRALETSSHAIDVERDGPEGAPGFAAGVRCQRGPGLKVNRKGNKMGWERIAQFAGGTWKPRREEDAP